MAIPALAQGGRFIKVDIVGKSVACHHHKQAVKDNDGPTEVHMRMPITLAKSVLEMAGDTEIKINGETKKGIKPDALIKMLESSKPGDLLLEITTDKGDLIKVTIE
jgi:hypothetical protein